jgi:ankyrin repeat protein
MNSLQRVQTVLQENPALAKQHFLDNDSEPPLCAAIRLGCSEPIIRLLLANGADVHATDIWGMSALHLVSSGKCPRFAIWTQAHFQPLMPSPTDGTQSGEQFEVSLAAILLDAGADPDVAMDAKVHHSRTSIELAQIHGKDHLVQLYYQASTPSK